MAEEPIRILGNEHLSERKERFLKNTEDKHEKLGDLPPTSKPRAASDAGLASRVALFNRRASEHQNRQKHNPFSGAWGGVKRHLNRDDPTYGRPDENSDTARRGAKAGQMVSHEIRVLTDIIYQYGERQDDGTASICFGELFQVRFLLLRALSG
ncbi:ABRA [Cordylochernes scorpioides]|uniref:ABRA n=1 Tax=Cordylochernes scorpioides TaxID=51811 RepID=A0ABY6L1V4_9ARAC|nr:ABRA [Cordylochernes scorpioides]